LTVGNAGIVLVGEDGLYAWGLLPDDFWQLIDFRLVGGVHLNLFDVAITTMWPRLNVLARPRRAGDEGGVVDGYY
jgi:hypothetical protein